MVELTVNTENKFYQNSFYFHNIDDCNKFKFVFHDHMCNVPWNPPKEVPDDMVIPDRKREYMDLDPVKFAEGNLSWGFNLMKCISIGLTEEQNVFVGTVVKKCDVLQYYPKNTNEKGELTDA